MKKQTNEKPSPYRWVILVVFMFVALISQLLWLTFAPITSEMVKLYPITTMDVSILSLVWPLVFVIFAIPVGVFIDQKGYKMSVGIGAVLLAVFASLRMLAPIFDLNFGYLLICQTGAAISQPFIFGTITKLAVMWFPEDEQGIATGLGSIGLFLGMMLALVITPFMYVSVGYEGMLAFYAILSILGLVLFFLLTKERDVSDVEEPDEAFSFKDLVNLSKARDFLILEIGFFTVVGGFTAIMTWLEGILHELHGISIEEAGLVGGALIIGGIIGSIVIPELSDRLKKLKIFIMIDLFVGTIALYLLGVFSSFMTLIGISFVGGFFLMSALPLVLEFSSRITEKGMEGRASSLLWFFSQVGSVVLILVVEPMRELFGTYLYSLIFIAILWFASMALIGVVREPERT